MASRVGRYRSAWPTSAFHGNGLHLIPGSGREVQASSGEAPGIGGLSAIVERPFDLWFA